MKTYIKPVAEQFKFRVDDVVMDIVDTSYGDGMPPWMKQDLDYNDLVHGG